MSYLQSYLDRIRSRGNPALADAISKTVEDVVPQYITNFSFTEHVVSLLVGDVQSGKTSHMFGLMCAAADESFMNFVFSTWRKYWEMVILLVSISSARCFILGE